MSFEKIVEALIKEAQERGDFDNLKGKGQPIDLNAYFETPEDMRLAYSALPKYDGWEICRHLKVAQALADVPTMQPFKGPWEPAVTNQDYEACENDYAAAVIELDKARLTIDAKMAKLALW